MANPYFGAPNSFDAGIDWAGWFDEELEVSASVASELCELTLALLSASVSAGATVDVDAGEIDISLYPYKSVTDEALALIMGGPSYSIVCDEACILWSAVLNCPIIAYIKDGSLYVTYNRQYGEGNWTVPAVNGSYTRIVGDGSLWSGNSFLAAFRGSAWYCLRLVEGDTKFREVAMITDDFDDSVSVTYHATRDSTARQMFYVNDGSDTTVFFSTEEGENWTQES